MGQKKKFWSQIQICILLDVSGILDFEYMPKETAGDEGLGIKDVIT